MNPIPAENALPGDSGWRIVRGDGAPSNALAAAKRPVHVEAYADRVSAKVGDVVRVMANVPDGKGSIAWSLYRLGWYGGAGARKLLEGTATAPVQPACPENTATGLVRCKWAKTFEVRVPEGAVSGLYVIRILRTVDQYGTYVPLVVRDDRMSDLYFQASVTTYQAYNRWMGESLYDDKYRLRSRFAVEVSWDRPYISDYGSGLLLRYEVPTAAFLERHGYDVSYTTNLDVSREGLPALRRHGVFLSTGHDEYWDGRERDTVESARDAGVHVFFLGANSAYWKTRLSDPGVDGNPRLMTCYKMRPQDDPSYSTPDQTGLFRGPDIARDEEALVGTTYEEQVLFGHPWVVADSAQPAYEGTGLATGDAIPGLVGYEYDTQMTFDTPGATSLLADSPVVDINTRPGTARSVTYRARSGALVFSAGSIYFAYGLDPFCATLDACTASDPNAPGPYHDARVERMLANLFKAALALPVPQALLAPQPSPSARVDPAWARSVTTAAGGLAGPSSIARLPNGDFVFADPRGNRLWRVSVAGAVTPFAGDGEPGGEDVAGRRFDNVPALKARFRGPSSVWADAAGNVYVADTVNSAIRKVANDSAKTVTTLAGAIRAYGFADGAPAAARFATPMGLAALRTKDPAGNLVATTLLVADQQNYRIRAVDLATGATTTAAGGDPAAAYLEEGPASQVLMNLPTAVATADDGRIFVLLSAGYAGVQVKMVGADGNAVLLTDGPTGYADGAGDHASLSAQGGLSWDGTALLVADAANQRIRRILPGTDASSTCVQTYAGNGRVAIVDGSGASASFGLPLGMWKDDGDGTVYVADGAGAIRAIQP